MTDSQVSRVAVIGAGPAGAIALAALAAEQCFHTIRVFERREGAGGCWIGDVPDQAVPHLDATEIPALASRTADASCPLAIPRSADLPLCKPASTAVPRYAESSCYAYLETNVDAEAMRFTREAIPAEPSAVSVALYGQDTPFRPWRVLQRYVRDVIAATGLGACVEYNTTVERIIKSGPEWTVTLRNQTPGATHETWWEEQFDAVVVATGHYWVPYIPPVDGLGEWVAARPGTVLHSKHFRGRDAYRGRRVVVVGASVSAADIAFDLADVVAAPVHAVCLGHKPNQYFGDVAFNHPRILQRPSIARVDAATATVHFVDGTAVAGVDAVVFGTGYSWTLPFLPHVPVRNNRIPGLFQHVVWRRDPTLLFVGAVGAGLTFKVFEWQAVYAARLLAGRGLLPSLEERDEWEAERVKVTGDGPAFALVFPHFREYFDELRRLAGPPTDGKGRELPPFRGEWLEMFMKGHERRKDMWRRLNKRARDQERYQGRVRAVL